MFVLINAFNGCHPAFSAGSISQMTGICSSESRIDKSYSPNGFLPCATAKAWATRGRRNDG